MEIDDYACGACPEAFNSVAERDYHRKEKHSYRTRVGRCAVCKSACPSFIAFFDHFTRSHSYEMYTIEMRADYRMKWMSKCPATLLFDLFLALDSDDTTDYSDEEVLIDFVDKMMERIHEQEEALACGTVETKCKDNNYLKRAAEPDDQSVAAMKMSKSESNGIMDATLYTPPISPVQGTLPITISVQCPHDSPPPEARTLPMNSRDEIPEVTNESYFETTDDNAIESGTLIDENIADASIDSFVNNEALPATIPIIAPTPAELQLQAQLDMMKQQYDKMQQQLDENQQQLKEVMARSTKSSSESVSSLAGHPKQDVSEERRGDQTRDCTPISGGSDETTPDEGSVLQPAETPISDVKLQGDSNNPQFKTHVATKEESIEVVTISDSEDDVENGYVYDPSCHYVEPDLSILKWEEQEAANFAMDDFDYSPFACYKEEPETMEDESKPDTSQLDSISQVSAATSSGSGSRATVVEVQTNVPLPVLPQRTFLDPETGAIRVLNLPTLFAHHDGTQVPTMTAATSQASLIIVDAPAQFQQPFLPFELAEAKVADAAQVHSMLWMQQQRLLMQARFLEEDERQRLQQPVQLVQQPQASGISYSDVDSALRMQQQRLVMQQRFREEDERQRLQLASHPVQPAPPATRPQASGNLDGDVHSDFWNGHGGDVCPACGEEVKKNPMGKRAHYCERHYDVYYTKARVIFFDMWKRDLFRFCGVNLGTEKQGKRICKFCSHHEARSRSDLLLHLKKKHPSEFAAFRAGYAHLQLQCAPFTPDEVVHELLKAIDGGTSLSQ